MQVINEPPGTGPPGLRRKSGATGGATSAKPWDCADVVRRLNSACTPQNPCAAGLFGDVCSLCSFSQLLFIFSRKRNIYNNIYKGIVKNSTLCTSISCVIIALWFLHLIFNRTSRFIANATPAHAGRFGGHYARQFHY